MLPTQWAELQARIRRFFRTVGQQSFNLDEVVSPTGQLVSLDGPPWRSDPIAWYGQIAATGAAAGNFNYGSAELNLTAARGGCALVTRVYVYARELLATGGPFDAILSVGPQFNNGNGYQLVEPVSFNGFNFSVPVRGGLSVTGTVPTNHATIARGEIYNFGPSVAVKYGHLFELDPPILLADQPANSAQSCVAVGIAANDSGGAPVDVQACFGGLYFNQYPQR